MNANYYIGTYLCFYASNPPSYPKQLCGKCNHFEKCFDFLFKKKDMETKEVKIEIPEGYEIDESKSSFKKIVFKKKEKKLPQSWQEYANEITGIKVQGFLGNAGIPCEYYDAFAALNKLIRLRDVYNDGWKPDWNTGSGFKQSIYYVNEEIKLDTRASYRCILTFKTKELRDEFYENFKDLIEQAKELL